jgi:hypothetical protein
MYEMRVNGEPWNTLDDLWEILLKHNLDTKECEKAIEDLANYIEAHR